MINKGVFVLVFALLFLNMASAQVQVDYFYKEGCSHCIIVENSGVLARVNATVPVTKYDILESAKTINMFNDYFDMFNVSQNRRGTPLLVVKYSDGTYAYFLGDTPIISNLESAVLKSSGNFKPINQTTSTAPDLTLGAIIVAGLIDSVNPCAFGVLIFLMISLLKFGSAKRALRYGLIYSFFVFLTYFLAGFGIFKVIQSVSVLSKMIYLALGIFILIMALLEFYDYFKTIKGKESLLKIPTSVKPLIEKVMSNGTLPAIVLAGILVSLFELPCTGGIYLAILTSMSQNETFSFLYLFLYNFIFVLPLVIITLIVYKGESTEFLHEWTNKNKKWMKLFAGFILIVLGLYILRQAGLF